MWEGRLGFGELALKETTAMSSVEYTVPGVCGAPTLAAFSPSHASQNRSCNSAGSWPRGLGKCSKDNVRTILRKCLINTINWEDRSTVDGGRLSKRGMHSTNDMSALSHRTSGNNITRGLPPWRLNRHPPPSHTVPSPQQNRGSYNWPLQP